MQQDNIVRIPNDIALLLDDLAHGDSLDENVRISIAISLFIAKSVSLAKAAEIAEVSLNDFIYLLKLKDIPWSSYTEGDFIEDEIAIKDLLRGKRKNDKSCM